MQNRQRSLIPCTALGCMELLTRSDINLRGKEAVLMGDSNVVGTPLAMLLRDSGIAALTLCRSAAPPSSLNRTAPVFACPRPTVPALWLRALTGAKSYPAMQPAVHASAVRRPRAGRRPCSVGGVPAPAARPPTDAGGWAQRGSREPCSTEGAAAAGTRGGVPGGAEAHGQGERPDAAGGHARLQELRVL